MRRRCALVLLLVLAGCGEAVRIPAVDLQLSVIAERDTVELAEGFPVTVVRIWSKRLEPEPWSDALLAPLTLVMESMERVEDAERVMETRRARAYAFTRRDLMVPAPAFKARMGEGGEVRIARADALRLRVTPLLDPDDPGSPELPGGPLAERTSNLPLWIGLGLLVAAVAFGLVRTRRRDDVLEMPPVRDAQPASAGAVALAELAALRSDPGETAQARCSVVEGVASVLRAYLSAEFGVRTRERTTPEILARATRRKALAGPGVEQLAALLEQCDLTKFAAHLPDADECIALCDAAERLVQETGGVAA